MKKATIIMAAAIAIAVSSVVSAYAGGTATAHRSLAHTAAPRWWEACVVNPGAPNTTARSYGPWQAIAGGRERAERFCTVARMRGAITAEEKCVARPILPAPSWSTSKSKKGAK